MKRTGDSIIFEYKQEIIELSAVLEDYAEKNEKVPDSIMDLIKKLDYMYAEW